MMKLVRNQKGLSIVEVLVAAGLTAVVSLGIATMIQNSMIEQKKTVLLNTLRENKIRIETMLRDQAAWSNTINDSTNAGTTPTNQSTTCLVNPGVSQCADIPATAPLKLIVRDAANNIAYNLLTWAGAGSNGFTEGGAACDSFSSTTGNDACPISYRLVYMYDCNGASPCGNPQVKIVARLIFNPSTTGVLNRFRGLIAQGSLTSIAADDAPGMGRYDAVVKRTAVQTNRHFRIAMVIPAGTSTGCASSGFGRCTPGATLTNYPVARTWSVLEDLYGLVTIDTAVSSRAWRFNETGPYSCTISAPAFSTGGFQIGLVSAWTAAGGGTELGSASTTAGQWASSNVVLESKFLVSATTGAAARHSIRQRCDAEPGGGAENCALGMALAPYTAATTIVTVTCYKIDIDN